MHTSSSLCLYPHTQHPPRHTHAASSINFEEQIKSAPGMFDKMFNTFKILQQSPAYKDAVAEGKDLSDAATVRVHLSPSPFRRLGISVLAFAP